MKFQCKLLFVGHRLSNENYTSGDTCLVISFDIKIFHTLYLKRFFVFKFSTSPCYA